MENKKSGEKKDVKKFNSFLSIAEHNISSHPQEERDGERRTFSQAPENSCIGIQIGIRSIAVIAIISGSIRLSREKAGEAGKQWMCFASSPLKQTAPALLHLLVVVLAAVALRSCLCGRIVFVVVDLIVAIYSLSHLTLRFHDTSFCCQTHDWSTCAE
jgi:hypothetical protein